MKFINDGSGRELRPIQDEVLRWVGDNWSPTKHLFVGLGVGGGKSACLRAIQRQVGGNILTSQNILIDQYKADYPELNDLKGGAHYRCAEYGTTCNIGSARYSCRGGVDSCCTYQNNREAFVRATPSILNLMSFYLNSTRFKVPPHTMLIDEAHTIPGLIRQITSTAVKFGPLEKALLNKLKYQKSDLASELKLCTFLRTKIDRLNELMMKEKNPDKVEKYFKQIENAAYTLEGFESQPEKYALEFEEGTLKVLPVIAPRKFMDRIIGRGGVLTSATLLPHDMRELYGSDKYTFKDFGTPIPAENRKIIYDPLPFGFNYDTIQPAAIAQRIMKIYEADPKPTVVHLTYGLALRLKEFMFHKDIIWHDKEGKSDAVALYKERGGILMASGLSEGLDLKDDLCRRQIITQLQFGNLGDLFTRKRKALPDGQNYYLGEVFKIFCQSVGRSTRSATDHSETIVLDSRFKRTFSAWKREGFVAKWFEESIDWGKHDR